MAGGSLGRGAEQSLVPRPQNLISCLRDRGGDGIVDLPHSPVHEVHEAREREQETEWGAEEGQAWVGVSIEEISVDASSHLISEGEGFRGVRVEEPASDVEDLPPACCSMAVVAQEGSRALPPPLRLRQRLRTVHYV